MRLTMTVMLALSVAPRLAVAESSNFATGEALMSLTAADHLLSVFRNGECGQYAPKGVSQSQQNLGKVTADLLKSALPEDQEEFQALVQSTQFRAKLRYVEELAITRVLATIQQDGANHAFACGVVFGGITQAMMRAESDRQNAIHGVR